MTTVLVCGGRNFGDPTLAKKDEKIKKEYEFIMHTLDKLMHQYSDDDGMSYKNLKIIAGAARGVDSAAIDWAIITWTDYKEYPAQWALFGKAAGHIRNQQMLTEGQPDLVIAFPGGTGTANMVEIAEKAKVKVIKVEYKE